MDVDKQIDINLKPTVNKKAEFFCVEYPGVVVNINDMLATLGGIENLEKVHSDPTKRLDLRYRPDDPCCRPLCADKSTCVSLLLRVSKYQRKKKSDSGVTTQKEFMYRQHICGVITSVYKFTSLCDYQYLPLRRNPETNEVQNMIPYLKIDNSTLLNEDFFSKEVPLFLPPPSYGRMDKSYAYLYRKEHHLHKRKNTDRRKTNLENQISTRKERVHNCTLVHYDAKTPNECKPKALEGLNSASSIIHEAAEKVKQIFKDRPVWSRNALQGVTGLTLHALKTILPAVAYYVVTGPWSRLWIRFGYDVKGNPAARFYQLVDFRLRQGIHTPHIPIRAKRGSSHYKLPQVFKKRAAAREGADSYFQNVSESKEEETSYVPERTSYIFESGVLPAHRNIFYQICDIRLPEVNEMVEKNVAEQCTKEDGWLLPNTANEIRNVLTKDIYKTLSVMRDTSDDNVDVDVSEDPKREQTPPAEEPSVIPPEDAEESDPEEESEESTSSSEDETAAGETQEDILTEAFSIEMDEPDLSEDDEFFFEDDEQIMDALIFNEPSFSKQS